MYTFSGWKTCCVHVFRLENVLCPRFCGVRQPQGPYMIYHIHENGLFYQTQTKIGQKNLIENPFQCVVIAMSINIVGSF